MRGADVERLYADHAQRLFGFLVYHTGDRALAEDLVGDTFERAFRSRGRYDPRKGSERTWLYALALNALRDNRRRTDSRARAQQRLAGGSEEGGVDPALARVEQRDELQRAVRNLSDEEREALALRFGADLTLAEIAAVVHEPRTTVEGRIYRALRKLRAELT